MNIKPLNVQGLFLHGQHETPLIHLGKGHSESIAQVFQLRNGVKAATKDDAKAAVTFVKEDLPDAYVNWMPKEPGNNGHGKGYMLVVAKGEIAESLQGMKNKSAVRKFLFHPSPLANTHPASKKPSGAPFSTFINRLMHPNGTPLKREEAKQLAEKLQTRLAGSATVKTLAVGPNQEGQYLLVATGRDAQLAKKTAAPGALKKLFGVFDKHPETVEASTVHDVEQRIFGKNGVLA